MKNGKISRRRSPAPAAKTSWEPVAEWYGRHIDSGASAFQREIIFPGALRLLDPKPNGTYLDVACGQGAFMRLAAQKSGAHMVGFDASPSLIEQAKKTASKKEEYGIADATDFADLFDREAFDGATCLMAIQNIDEISQVFQQVASVLKPGSPFVIVMNHPCFRQPSQSGWGWDEQRKLQYRRVDRYASSYHAPIIAHPGKAPSVVTHSYHRPLEAYVTELAQNGFVIDALEEWVSDKSSDSGPRAKAENVARKEIPMFLAIRARKMT
ncbi:MAG: class I SAM-dependent methyltransferase [bacterium]|nr:class I SAM-dependent methyltransferase [bacterium]